MSYERIVSTLLALFYIVGAYFYVSTELAWKLAIGVIFPLGCIWFAEEMGSYIGPLSRSLITKPTPKWLLRIGAWLLLLLPVFIYGVCIILKKN